MLEDLLTPLPLLPNCHRCGYEQLGNAQSNHYQGPQGSDHQFHGVHSFCDGSVVCKPNGRLTDPARSTEHATLVPNRVVSCYSRPRPDSTLSCMEKQDVRPQLWLV